VSNDGFGLMVWWLVVVNFSTTCKPMHWTYSHLYAIQPYKWVLSCRRFDKWQLTSTFSPIASIPSAIDPGNGG